MLLGTDIPYPAFLLARSLQQVDIVNGLQLLTAKPVIYLVNLSERDYIRKKNKWLPKIKQWVDDNNPGDLIIPFSVALEERLTRMTDEEQKKELEAIGATSALGKIMTAGYQALHVSHRILRIDAQCY
jgi:obg-like ATPase 1